MGSGITGTYEGEGPNVGGALNITNVPDVPSQNKQRTTTGQGMQVGVVLDIRRRIRTSSEPARGAVVINYGSGDQTFTKCTRAILISGAGALVVRFADDSADVTIPSAALTVGQVYSFSIAIIRQSGSAGAGIALF